MNKISCVIVFKLILKIIFMHQYVFATENVFGMYINPYIRPDNFTRYAYSKDDISSLVSVAATKSSLLLLDPPIRPSPFPFQVFEGTVYIPEVVALYNQNNNSNRIKLWVSFNGELGTTSDLSSLDIAIRLINTSNFIFPKTVDTLLLDKPLSNAVELIDKKSLETVANALQSAKMYTERNQLFLFYKIYESDKHCINKKSNGSYFLVHHIKRVLRYVDGILIHEKTELNDAAIGPIKRKEKLVELFFACKNAIKKFNPSIKVHLSSSWPSGGLDNVPGSPLESNRFYSESTLVEYWTLMKNWSEETKQTVFMEGAFDVALYRHHEGKLGWWKLQQNLSRYSKRISEQWFLEKYPTSLNESYKVIYKSEENEGTSKINVSVIVIPTLSAMLLLLVAGILRKFLVKGKNKIESLSEKSNSKVEFCEQNNIDFDFKCYQHLELDKRLYKIDWSKILGAGIQGSVFEGEINHQNLRFAFKTTNITTSIAGVNGIINEIKILSSIKIHPNIVQLRAINTSDITNRSVHIAFDLCFNGSLKNYLISNQTILKKDMKTFFVRSVQWCFEISLAMVHISEHKIIHGDLAARNVLLTDTLSVKICDFGLALKREKETIQLVDPNRPKPIRWMAVEAFKSGIFSELSDVWSFGVTMWEIFSFGELPYKSCSNDEQLTFKIENGLRPSKPCAFTGVDILKLMTSCWKKNATKRQNFLEISEKLKSKLETFKKMDGVNANEKHLSTDTTVL